MRKLNVCISDFTRAQPARKNEEVELQKNKLQNVQSNRITNDTTTSMYNINGQMRLSLSLSKLQGYQKEIRFRLGKMSQLILHTT